MNAQVQAKIFVSGEVGLSAVDHLLRKMYVLEVTWSPEAAEDIKENALEQQFIEGIGESIKQVVITDLKSRLRSS